MDEEAYVAGIPREEQETVVNFTWSDDFMTIYTTEQRVMTKLDRYAEGGDYEVIEEHRLKGRVVGKTYKADKSLLTFRAKKKVMTDEEKAKARENALKHLHGKA